MEFSLSRITPRSLALQTYSLLPEPPLGGKICMYWDAAENKKTK